MAQTKRKRQTKHRGNAAGVVESRGRTGRKPTGAEKTGKPSAPKLTRRSAWKAAYVAGSVLQGNGGGGADAADQLCF